MSDSTTLELPPDLVQPGSFLQTILTVSLTAVAVLRPLYGPDGVRLDDFAWVYLNPAGQHLLGQPERPAASLLTLFPTAQADGVFAKCCRAFETGELQRHQTTYQADGLDGYFLLAAQRHQNLLVVSFTATNDQPRSAVAEALRESQAQEQHALAEAGRRHADLQRSNWELEERVRERTAQVVNQQRQLDDVLENVPAAIATLSGPEHRFSFANARYQYLVGNRVQVGLTVAEALPEVVEQGVIELLDRVYQTGEPFIGQGVMIMLEQPPGPPHQFYYDLTYLALRDGQGQVQGILVFAVEVTEQVRARRQTALLQAEVLAGTQRRALERQDVLQVFAHAPLAVALLREPDHQLDYWNALLDQYFPGAKRGIPLEKALPALATPAVVAQLDRLYQNGETYRSEPTLLPGATPGAAKRYVIFTYQAYQENRRVAGVALFLQDVTEQVLSRHRVQHLNEELTATNQELHQSNHQLTRTNADLDTFIYTASHDLRSPVANIEGLLAALRQELLDEPITKQAVEHLLTLIDGSINRFYVTVGQLTNILHQQHHRGIGAELVDVTEVVEGVRLDLALLLQEAGGELLVDTHACPALHAAAKDLRSIVFNLLSNAIKYRAPDRPLRVELRTACTEQWHELRVQDNGLGLSPEQQTELFTLFKRLHTHVEGSGVGLYAIKKLIENEGGSIRVESAAGVGSTFIVQLPA